MANYHDWNTLIHSLAILNHPFDFIQLLHVYLLKRILLFQSGLFLLCKECVFHLFLESLKPFNWVSQQFWLYLGYVKLMQNCSHDFVTVKHCRATWCMMEQHCGNLDERWNGTYYEFVAHRHDKTGRTKTNTWRLSFANRSLATFVHLHRSVQACILWSNV